ncbi:pectin lyase-like protein [Wilcoxina mikolae CBS 423.85]|nr:pectin lyase-like protein [Wilcoxina mikolae CBS 423.85]
MKSTTLLGSLFFSFAALVFAAPADPPIPTYFNLDFSQVGWSLEAGGTTGGLGGPVITVTTCDELLAAVLPDTPKIVYVKGQITMTARAIVGNNTSLIGVGSDAELIGWGLWIVHKENVIVRNLGIHHCIAPNDSITAKYSHHLWFDHNEFWSERSHGVDYYDGLVDVTRGCDYVTVSWNYFHSHWKTSLVGGDPTQRAEEEGKYHITFHHNYWRDLSTRTPALRFSDAHIFNNYYEDITAQGIHSRNFAQVIIEGNVFCNVTEPISTYGMVIPADSPNTSPLGDFEPDGFANVRENDFGGGKINITQVGDLTKPDYKYRHIYDPLHKVKEVVLEGCGRGKIGI